MIDKSIQDSDESFRSLAIDPVKLGASRGEFQFFSLKKLQSEQKKIHRKIHRQNTDVFGGFSQSVRGCFPLNQAIAVCIFELDNQ